MNSFLINPYEFIGIAHNEGLDYVVNNLPSDPTPTIDVIIRLVSDYACRQLRPDESYSKTEFYAMTSIVSYSIIHLNEIKSAYHEANLNERQIIFLERMLCVNPYVRLESQREFYRQVEGEIFAYPMSYKEKELLLIASSVGKHSSEYWENNYNNAKSPWQRWFPAANQTGTPLAKKSWPREDAKGAVAGAIGGAIAGSPLLGGPGVVIGGIGGAIGGGIGASVADVLF